MQYTDYMHMYVYMYRLYTMWFRVCGCHHCRLNTPDVSYEILHDCFPKSDLINLQIEPDAGGTPSPTPSSKVGSPAASTPSTVPGTDEDAQKMASEKYQQHLAEVKESEAAKALASTPEGQVRQTSSPLPTLARMQSTRLFGDEQSESAATPTDTTAETPSPPIVNTTSETNKSKVKTKAKGKCKRKAAKRLAACKTKAKQPALPPVPSPEIVSPTQPPVEPAAPDTPAAPPTPEVKVEAAAAHPLGQATLNLLNRGSTNDMMDLDTLQNMVNQSVNAAVDARSETGRSVASTRVTKQGRKRNKDTHKRRMRFYRSLSSC